MATTLRHGDATQTQAIINISPTLIIGLGGSGKEVLMRLRKLFYTNTRSTGLPVIEYLWIDTDIRRQDIMERDYDAISEQLYLPKTDTIDAQVDATAVKDYFDHSNKYGHIFSWLHGSISQLGHKILVDGASQVRPCGRLAFFKHFDKIRSRIRNKLGIIIDQNTIDKVAGKYNVDNKPNVIIIASVAGGTGAGMFLDTSFLVRSIDPNILPTGIFFLPSLFDRIGGTDDSFKSKIHGNAYAALKELDYFMAPFVGTSPGTGKFPTFDFNWDGKKKEEIIAPPFGNVYFLDGKNRSDKRFSEITEITQMAAEFIYLEFTRSQFGDKKRSIRSNVNSFLIDETRYYETNPQSQEIYSQYFPNRYSSFGISSIKLDIERMRNAAAYYLAKSLAGYWLSGREAVDKPDVESVFSLSGQPGRFLTFDIISDNFLRDDKNESLFNISRSRINEKVDEIVKMIEKAFNRNTPESMLMFYKNDSNGVVDTVFKCSQGVWKDLLDEVEEKLGHNGEDTKIIVDNAERVYTELKSACEEKLHFFISRPGEKGIAAAAELLKLSREMLTVVIEREFRDAKEKERKIPIEKKSPVVNDKEIELYKKFAIEAKNIKVQPFSKTATIYYQDALEACLRKFLSSIREDLNKDTEKLRSKLLEWYSIKYRNSICDKTRNILENLLRDIERWESRINKYKTGLTELEKYFNAFFEAFNSQEIETRNIYINLNTDDDWFKKHILTTLKVEHPAGDTLSWKDLLDKETESLFKYSLDAEGIESLAKIVPTNMPPDGEVTRAWGFSSLYMLTSERAANHAEWLNLRKFIDNSCFKKMGDFLAETNADVEFQEKSSNKQHDIEKVTSLADAWIARSASDPNIGPCIRYVGVPSLKSTITVDEASLRSPLFATPEKFSYEKGDIVFFTELAAFPIFSIGSLEESRAQYYEAIKENSNVLYQRYIDYRLIDDLRDILPPSNQTIAMDIYKTGQLFLEALLLGIIIVESDDNPRNIYNVKTNEYFSFVPPTRDDMLQPLYLGSSVNTAILRLFKSSEYHDALKKEIEKSKRNFIGKDGEMYKKALKIIQYYLMEVFPILTRHGEGAHTEEASNLHLIIRGLRYKYIDEYKRSAGIGEIEWKEIESIDINEISEVFTFSEKEARSKLRVLKIYE